MCNFDLCGCIQYVYTVCYVNWMSVCISLSLSFLPFLFLTRSGTVHILHNNMSPALSQWWYSQHLALYHDLHFSYLSSFSPQRHHWVPQHLLPSHGYMWAHINPTIKPTQNLQKHHIYHCYCPFFVSAVGSARREGGVPAYINLSASSMLMIAMQYTSNPVYHCQLLECLMKHKQEVWKVCHNLLFNASNTEGHKTAAIMFGYCVITVHFFLVIYWKNEWIINTLLSLIEREDQTR